MPRATKKVEWSKAHRTAWVDWIRSVIGLGPLYSTAYAGPLNQQAELSALCAEGNLGNGNRWRRAFK